jgi:hypothetical protein
MELITILLFLIALPVILELLFWAACLVVAIVCAPFCIIEIVYNNITEWFKEKFDKSNKML